MKRKVNYAVVREICCHAMGWKGGKEDVQERNDVLQSGDFRRPLQKENEREEERNQGRRVMESM